ncbi:hypothetical protein N7533_009599 [Penicillium manginii]|uniref:uncharacterized protein n=1 Tax=Penicillium manginii TaxID=203109 RepID=UPI002549294E|nr:uncharacterized protein N7533_009599 [Penicillium manginii]KAJ5744729.1 hypothetical protein N7533_009599 [Penicillium manginii]
MQLILKGDSRRHDAFIEAGQKSAIPELKKDYQVCLFRLSPSESPVFAGPSWELKGAQLATWKKLKDIKWAGKTVYIWTAFPNKCRHDFEGIKSHMTNLVGHIRKSLQANGKMRSFWYAEQNPLPESSKAPRRPMMPWLFDDDGQYQIWDTYFDFFLDEEDHRSRLVEATIIEQNVQWTTYDEVFCESKTHDVILERPTSGEAYWKLHVWMNADPKPAPPETIEAKFEVNVANSALPKARKLVIGTGTCIDSSRADFAILTRAHFDPALDGQTKKITATLTVNLKSTALQIDALEVAGRTSTFGDHPKSDGYGFSLKRTILAQGSEVCRTSPFYFELNVKDISVVPPELQKERIDFILGKYVLDSSQRQAVENSVFKVVAGISLVKGPPGNGKTRTTLVMLLILTSLGMKVLICAGSNQAVDTLLLAFHEALKGDSKLAGWCGLYCRFKTSSHQMGVLRRASKAKPSQGISDNSSSVEKALADCQIEALVVKKATEYYDQQPDAKKLIDLLDQDRQSVLDKDTTVSLRNCYEKVLRRVIGQCKVVAATLNASGDENLKAGFQPYALLCDEAGQCLEGDSMIPLTGYLTLRTVPLIGDPDQLPPDGCILARERRGKVPCLLAINYRCHPDILDWPASAIYKSKITACAGNTKAERVGSAWQAFTASHHHFKGLIGKRRIVIDAPGVAEQPERSTSWRNDGQIDVVMTFLKALYADGSTNDPIVPEDVVLICPYRAQVKRVIERFASAGVKYDRCLTVDGSQGQESNVVIFMFTKPRTFSTTDVGFVSHYQRLNVAMTRARKLLVAVVNLRIWNQQFRTNAKLGSTRYLASFLQDAVDKGHVLQWVGTETVERLTNDAPQHRKTTSVSNVSGVSHPAPQPPKRPGSPNHPAPPRRQQSPLAPPIPRHSGPQIPSALPGQRASDLLYLKRGTTKKESLRKQRADLDAQEDALDARLAEVAKDMAALKLEESRTYKTKGA